MKKCGSENDIIIKLQSEVTSQTRKFIEATKSLAECRQHQSI